MRQAGFAKLTGSQWLGLSAPKGLPAPIVQRLSALIPEIFSKPDMMSRLEDLQTLPRRTPVLGNEFVQLINSQIETWRAVEARLRRLLTARAINVPHDSPHAIITAVTQKKLVNEPIPIFILIEYDSSMLKSTL